MAHGNRPDRVSERVRTELSVLLVRSVRDPGVASVTVTRVAMTADLQLARVYYTVTGDEDRRDAARGLRRAHAYLRRELGQRLQLRYVPELRFIYDDSAEKEDRIARIFDEIANTRADVEVAAGDDVFDRDANLPHGK